LKHYLVTYETNHVTLVIQAESPDDAVRASHQWRTAFMEEEPVAVEEADVLLAESILAETPDEMGSLHVLLGSMMLDAARLVRAHFRGDDETFVKSMGWALASLQAHTITTKLTTLEEVTDALRNFTAMSEAERGIGLLSMGGTA